MTAICIPILQQCNTICDQMNVFCVQISSRRVHGYPCYNAHTLINWLIHSLISKQETLTSCIGLHRPRVRQTSQTASPKHQQEKSAPAIPFHLYRHPCNIIPTISATATPILSATLAAARLNSR